MVQEKVIDEAIREATSITHKHILSIINSSLSHPADKVKPIRILDSGCGNCELIAYLENFLPKFNPGLQFEVFGFDVVDSRVQFSDFFGKANRMLAEKAGHVDWGSRLKMIRSEDDWPFDDASFDIVLSNQVVEHVQDHNFFFAQNYRVLKSGGFSVHLFPVKNYIMEGHIHLPLVHRFRQWSVLYRSIRTLSLLGLGRWKKISDKCSVDEFARSYADFLTHYCNYVSVSDLMRFGKRHGFRAGFRYTGNFYYEKVKELLGIRHRFLYNRKRQHALSIHFFKYVQCITLFLEKIDEYDNYIAKYCSNATAPR